MFQKFRTWSCCHPKMSFFSFPFCFSPVFGCGTKGGSHPRKCLSAILSPKEVASAARGCFVKDEVLLRKWLSGSKVPLDQTYIQVVLPMSLWENVLRTAHGGVAGHLGINKTGKPNQYINPAQLYPIPATDPPFPASDNRRCGSITPF